MHKIMDRGRARLVVATAGAQGAEILNPEGLLAVPAISPPAPVVDSNVAGFLFGWLNRESLQSCGCFGAIAGGHACTVPSDQVDPISRAELLARTKSIEERG